jgi:hypothetical protein
MALARTLPLQMLELSPGVPVQPKLSRLYQYIFKLLLRVGEGRCGRSGGTPDGGAVAQLIMGRHWWRCLKESLPVPSRAATRSAELPVAIRTDISN